MEFPTVGSHDGDDWWWASYVKYGIGLAVGSGFEVAEFFGRQYPCLG